RCGRVLQVCNQPPHPLAIRYTAGAPRTGFFVPQSPGVLGAAAFARPVRAPCASGNMLLSS
ncbi:hypothetical protein, partial [Escherichia coli]|uniref:hypothetical protein n=1 Tax=Escherichia coli TaxID=562 RepID=UPI002FF423C0